MLGTATVFAGLNPRSPIERRATPWIPSARRASALAAHDRRGVTRSFTAGATIFGDGDDAQYIYKITTGIVRSCKIAEDGRRQIEAFHMSGDVLGFEGGGTHRLAAEAVSDCSLLSFDRRGFDDRGGADDLPFFAYALRCLDRAHDHSLLLGRRGATAKIAGFLLEMALRGKNPDIVQLAMPRQDIADYLLVTLETVSRTLSQLEREGVIKLLSTRRIALRDRAALAALNA